MGLARTGLIDGDAPTARPSDPLAGVSWPVFDCLAEQLEITPDPMFRLGEEATTLADFAAQSYAAYAEADRSVLAAVPSVDRAMNVLERIGLR